MEVPWLSGACPDHPHIWFPFASESISNKQSLPILNSSPKYTSYTVPTPSISFILEETADVPCTQPRGLPPHCFHTPILWPKVRINLALLRYRTRLSTAGARHHNHHATTYGWVPNFRVCLFPLPSPGLQPHPYTRWRQGRHIWQIVRKLPMEAGCQDAPLALRDLAVSNLQGCRMMGPTM